MVDLIVRQIAMLSSAFATFLPGSWCDSSQAIRPTLSA